MRTLTSSFLVKNCAVKMCKHMSRDFSIIMVDMLISDRRMEQLLGEQSIHVFDVSSVGKFFFIL